MDAAGNVYVTGSSIATVASDYATIKYRGDDGAQLWVSHYNGPSNSFDTAKALAVTADGQVVVTGEVTGTSNNYNFATVSYSIADGAQNWARLYSSSNFSDRARCIVGDTSGDIYVSGKSRFSVATIKYRGSDGVELWSAFEGDGTEVNDLVVDPMGDLYVVGHSAEGFLTSKRQGGSGALSWSRAFATHIDSRTYSAAIDSIGNVLVIGLDYLDGAYKYAVVSYNAATGGENWVSRSNLNTESNRSAASIKIAPDGSMRFIVSASTSVGPRISVSKMAALPDLFASGFE